MIEKVFEKVDLLTSRISPFNSLVDALVERVVPKATALAQRGCDTNALCSCSYDQSANVSTVDYHYAFTSNCGCIIHYSGYAC